MGNQEKLAEAYHWRGMSYRQAGKVDVAIDCLKKAAELGYNSINT